MQNPEGKLVRDKIPEIIRENGEEPRTRILNEAEYLEALDHKLQEEVEEYLECNDLDELADVLEVISAIIIARGSFMSEIERTRLRKRNERGGFVDRIFLETQKKH